MPDEARLIGAAAVSLIGVWILTPVALRVAVRTGFYDHPTGYKAHGAPTAYLGGAAVIAAFLLAAVTFGEDRRFAPILLCAVGLAVVGTWDDRFTVRPSRRIASELAAAVVLWHFGLGWDFLASDLEQLVLTCAWIVGFTNAFNLMDNMDGAASTVAAVCAAGIAAEALIVGSGDTGLAVVALALAGGCLGFLRYNLRAGAPARIFLGDGGSMPIGFVVAALAMSIPVDEQASWPVLLTAGLLLGLPVLDTLLVVVSRTRRRVALVTAGRDHLTHRLQMKLASPRAVAAVLALTQCVVSGLAIVAAQIGRTSIIVAALTCLAAGAAVVVLLDTPAWTSVRWRRVGSYEKRDEGSTSDA